MWQDFSNQNNVILYICMRAALRRGVLNNKQELQYNNDLIHDVFCVCGLSSIMENLLSCDRFVQF